jgi:hypothetical protein
MELQSLIVGLTAVRNGKLLQAQTNSCQESLMNSYLCELRYQTAI